MSKIEQKCQKAIPGSNFGAKKAEKNLAAKKNLRTNEKGMWPRVCARVCARRVCVRARRAVRRAAQGACPQMHIYFVTSLCARIPPP